MKKLKCTAATIKRMKTAAFKSNTTNSFQLKPILTIIYSNRQF